MNAQLVVDINSKKEKSRFVKIGPSIFGLNKNFKEPKIVIKPANNGKIISEDFVKNSIIKWLSANGWGHFQFGDLHQQGVDIRAKHHQYSRYFLVEAKGQGKIRQADEVAFVYSLGQIITRMKTNKTTRYYFGLGLPDVSAKIALRRFQIVEKSADEVFGDYVHMGGKISVLTILTGTTDSALAREIGMQVAASNPRATRRDEVDASILEKEKEVYMVQLKAQNKPENIIENIVKGKMEKFYSEACLLEQLFIKDEEKTVQKYLDSKGAGISVKTFYRFELGEGIEKVMKDFAAEVAEQMG